MSSADVDVEVSSEQAVGAALYRGKRPRNDSEEEGEDSNESNARPHPHPPQSVLKRTSAGVTESKEADVSSSSGDEAPCVSEEANAAASSRTSEKDEALRKLIAGTEASLPKTGLVWCVVFTNAEVFGALAKIAAPVLTERIRFYPTKRRGFVGILLDEFDPSHAALMIGRLCCPVRIFCPTSGEEQETGECSVTVPTESLMSTLKGMSAVQTVAIYQCTNSSNMHLSILDAGGHVRHDEIPTLCGTAHSTLRTLQFQYEVTFGVCDFKRDIGHVSAKGIAVVTISLRKVCENTFLLVLTGNGERGSTFASLPISRATTQRSRKDPSIEAGEAVDSSLVHTVASLHAPQFQPFDKEGNEKGGSEGIEIPTGKEDIEKLDEPFKASFSVRYLEKMIKSLKEESQMTFFLGNRPSILPLIIRFGLDVKQGVESYAAFVLAANVEETA